MIEKSFPQKKIKEFKIKEYLGERLNKPGYSHAEMQRTPLGERIVIYTSKPGLIVGKKGENIQEITETLKNRFGLENPQVEVAEVENPNLNPQAIARSIVHTFERYGPKRFKYTGHNSIQTIINAGAIGAEIVISGRGIPSSRAKMWRFKQGYLKKSGDIAENYIKRGFAVAHLKSGAIGIKVFILTPDIKLPDKIETRPVIETNVPIEKEIISEAVSKQEPTPEITESKEEVKVEKKAPRKRVKKQSEDKNGDIKE
jgi:small subunit ribosomal protein S3